MGVKGKRALRRHRGRVREEDVAAAMRGVRTVQNVANDMARVAEQAQTTAWRMQAERNAALDNEKQWRELLDEIADRLKTALGPNTALVPNLLKKTRETQGQQPWPYPEEPILTDVDLIPIRFDAPIPRTSDIRDSRVAMLHLAVKIRDCPYELRRLVSFMNVNHHEGVSERCMAVSREALMTLGWRREHLFFIAKELLSLLPKEASRATGRT